MGDNTAKQVLWWCQSVTEPGSSYSAQQDKMLGLCGLMQRGVIHKGATWGDRKANLQSDSPTGRGWSISGIKTEEAGWFEAWGVWGKMTGKRCHDYLSVQGWLSYLQKVTRKTLMSAQLKGHWFHPLLTTSAWTGHSKLQIPSRQLGQTSCCSGYMPLRGHASLKTTLMSEGRYNEIQPRVLSLRIRKW